MCPFVEWAPRDPLEQRAWTATAGDGAWRFHWYSEKDGDKHISVRKPEGLVMSEALARACPPGSDRDDDEREALVSLFAAIEAGAITGAHRKTETEQERSEEEGSHD